MGEVMHPVLKLQNGVRTPTVSTKWMWGRSHGFQRSGNQARVTKTTFCQPNPTYKTVSHPNSPSKTGWQPNSSYNVVSKQVLLTKREYPSFASICQRYLLMCLPRSFFWFKGIVCLYIFIFRRIQNGLAPTLSWQKRSGNQALVTTQLAIKFCLQNGLAPKLSLQNDIAARLESRKKLSGLLWQPNYTYKPV